MHVYSLSLARRAYFRSEGEATDFLVIARLENNEDLFSVLGPFHVDEGPMFGCWCVMIAPITDYKYQEAC